MSLNVIQKAQVGPIANGQSVVSVTFPKPTQAGSGIWLLFFGFRTADPYSYGTNSGSDVTLPACLGDFSYLYNSVSDDKGNSYTSGAALFNAGDQEDFDPLGIECISNQLGYFPTVVALFVPSATAGTQKISVDTLNTASANEFGTTIPGAWFDGGCYLYAYEITGVPMTTQTGEVAQTDTSGANPVGVMGNVPVDAVSIFEFAFAQNGNILTPNSTLIDTGVVAEHSRWTFQVLTGVDLASTVGFGNPNGHSVGYIYMSFIN